MFSLSQNAEKDMSLLNDLYQEVIVDHAKNPRFKSKMSDCCFCQEGKNPLCGDTLTLYCRISSAEGSSRLNFSFEGKGCSISQASASMMCEMLQNTDVSKVRLAIEHAERIYTGKIKTNPEDVQFDIESLSGVSQFPVRIKCAALPWKTLELLLQQHFDAQGNPLLGCDKSDVCPKVPIRKIKIVTTE